MNIENLEEGMEVKNYKELCKLLEMPVKTSNSKKSQMKELERYVDFEQKGQKIIIQEIYSQPKEKVDNRLLGNNRKEFSNYIIEKDNDDLIGVYKIILSNKIYIGSTIKGFRQRFLEHNYKHSCIKTTYNMLKQGATFNILEVCNGLSEKEIRDREQYYIDQYRNNKSWIVVNERDTWSMIDKKPKIKFSKIKVNKVNYKKAIQILKENNIDIY